MDTVLEMLDDIFVRLARGKGTFVTPEKLGSLVVFLNKSGNLWVRDVANTGLNLPKFWVCLSVPWLQVCHFSIFFTSDPYKVGPGSSYNWHKNTSYAFIFGHL